MNSSRSRCFALALAATAAGAALRGAEIPNRPDPREIPLPRIKTSLGTLPGVDALPIRQELPDVLTMNDGTKVKTVEQWKKRREEIRRTLEYYATGQPPPAPGNVKGHEVKAETVLDGKVKYRLVHLTFGPEEKLALDIGIFTPAEGGPFPAIISQSGSPPGAPALPRLGQGPGQGRGLDVLLPVEIINEQVAAADAARGGGGAGGGGARGPRGGAAPAPAAAGGVPPGDLAPAAPAGGRGGFGAATAESVAGRNAEVFRRGYALVVYNNNDCAEDTTLRSADGQWAFRSTRFFPAYPGYDWGILAAWAWGASRVADYLETDSSIDKTKLIITGASRAGKSALIAAAYDDRLMGAPVVTGGGGVGAYRYAGPRNSETLDIMERKYPNWFSPNLHEFWGQREKLPFDEHWFLALCAPRPFVALEGDTDTISLPEAVKQSILHARPAYALFGAEQKLGVHYSHHGHAFTAEDWTAMMNFADRHLLGKKDNVFDWFPTEAELDAVAATPAGRGARGPGAPARAPQPAK
jgi:hypothetical protein